MALKSDMSSSSSDEINPEKKIFEVCSPELANLEITEIICYKQWNYN